MGRRSRTKGHQWEREAARDLTGATEYEHKRVLTETRDGGGIDLRAEGWPFVYQNKCGARPDVFGALREATEDASESEIPVAAIHRTGRGGEKIAVLDWQHWLALQALLATASRT